VYEKLLVIISTPSKLCRLLRPFTALYPKWNFFSSAHGGRRGYFVLRHFNGTDNNVIFVRETNATLLLRGRDQRYGLQRPQSEKIRNKNRNIRLSFEPIFVQSTSKKSYENPFYVVRDCESGITYVPFFNRHKYWIVWTWHVHVKPTVVRKYEIAFFLRGQTTAGSGHRIVYFRQFLLSLRTIYGRSNITTGTIRLGCTAEWGLWTSAIVRRVQFR